MTTKLSLVQFLQNSSDEPYQLPKLPTDLEIKLIRKGLRKKMVPDISLLPNEFGYEEVGQFSKELINGSIVFQWMTNSYESPKSRSYQDLCMNEDSEKDRLELGWMIADFARIDAMSHLSQMRPISYADHHQNLFNRQYAKQKRHFEKIENEWRHWSIVSAGHMNFG